MAFWSYPELGQDSQSFNRLLLAGRVNVGKVASLCHGSSPRSWQLSDVRKQIPKSCGELILWLMRRDLGGVAESVTLNNYRKKLYRNNYRRKIHDPQW